MKRSYAGGKIFIADLQEQVRRGRVRRSFGVWGRPYPLEPLVERQMLERVCHSAEITSKQIDYISGERRM